MSQESRVQCIVQHIELDSVVAAREHHPRTRADSGVEEASDEEVDE